MHNSVNLSLIFVHKSYLLFDFGRMIGLENKNKNSKIQIEMPQLLERQLRNTPLEFIKFTGGREAYIKNRRLRRQPQTPAGRCRPAKPIHCYSNLIYAKSQKNKNSKIHSLNPNKVSHAYSKNYCCQQLGTHFINYLQVCSNSVSQSWHRVFPHATSSNFRSPGSQ